MMLFFAPDNDARMSDMPSILSCSLHDRFRASAESEAWRIECENAGWEWARVADEHFRAVSDLHPEKKAILRVGVKDNIHCRGFSTRLGTRRYRQYPKESAAALEQVPTQYITCKTQLTEVTLGLDAGCGNPLVPDGWPGASSTGSAVAVAANICDVAIGTDSLGSVRIPAAACGVISLRMTYTPEMLRGVLPISPSFDALGWFGRTLDDLRFALEKFNVLRDVAKLERPAFRLGIVTEVLEDPYCDQDVLLAYRMLFDSVPDDRVELVEISLGEEVWNSRAAAWKLCARESFESLSLFRERLAPIGDDVRRVLDLGERVSAKEARRIRLLQATLQETMLAQMKDWALDAFILPVYPFHLPSPAEISTWPMLFPDVHDASAENAAGYAPLASVLGWPALSIPVFQNGSRQEKQNQLGFQLVGRPYCEKHLMDLGKLLTIECK